MSQIFVKLFFYVFFPGASATRMHPVIATDDAASSRVGLYGTGARATTKMRRRIERSEIADAGEP